jgi:polar amino acid transport system substrate-binding protein
MKKTLSGLARFARCCVLLAGVAAALLPAAARADIWTVTSEDNFPPYNFWMKGKRAGVDVAVADAILAQAGASALHRGLSWEEVLRSLDKNRTDLGFQLVAAPERFKEYHMVGPFRTGTTVLVGRADFAGKFETLDDLRGLRIGVVSGFNYTPEFDEAKGFERVFASTNLTSFRRLMLGTVDLIAGDLKAIQYIAENDGMAAKMKVLPTPLGYVPRYFAVPLERKDKAARFTAAFEKLKEDGTIQRIIDNWQSPVDER